MAQWHPPIYHTITYEIESRMTPEAYARWSDFRNLNAKMNGNVDAVRRVIESWGPDAYITKADVDEAINHHYASLSGKG